MAEKMKGPDGKDYYIDLYPNETMEQARARFESSFSTTPQQTQGMPNLPEGYETFKVGGEEYAPNAGIIYRGPRGEMGYVDPAYSTTDEAEVQDIFQGISPAQQYQQRQYEDIVSMNPVTTRAQVATRGIPFVGEYVDELAGAVVSPQRQAEIRLGRKSMEETRPIETGLIEIGTGIATGGGLAGAATKGAKTGGGLILKRGLQGMAAGSAEGGISGYGRGETPEERVRQAKFGFGFGGATGGAGGAVGGFLEGSLARRFAAVDVDDLAKELNISREAAIKLKDFSLGASSPEEIRENMIRFGADARIIDASPAAADLLDFSRVKMGDAATTARAGVQEMSEERGGRFLERLNTIFRPFDENLDAEDVVRSINQRTAPARNKAYNDVYTSVIDYDADSGKKIIRVLGTIPANIRAEAIERANISMAAADNLDFIPIPFRTIKGSNGEDVVEFMPNMTPMHLDYIKRALGDMAFDTARRGTQLGNDFASLSRKLKKAMYEALPRTGERAGYRQAVQLGLENIQEKEAVELATKFLRKNTSVGTVRRFFESAESEAQRQVMKDSLRSMIGAEMRLAMSRVKGTLSDPNASEDSIRSAMKVVREYGTPENIKKLRLVIGPEDTKAFQDEIAKISQQVGIEGSMAINSRTAMRQAALDQLEQESGRGVRRAIEEVAPVRAVQEFGKRYLGDIGLSEPMQVTQTLNEVANALVNVKGDAARSAVESIQKLQRNQPITDEAAKELSRYITITVPLGVYQTAETIGSREQ